jgi:hypothetical protein
VAGTGKRRSRTAWIAHRFLERSKVMRIRDEHMTNTTSPPPAEQGASGASSKLVHHGPPSGLAQVWHFLLHFVQMCVVMCVGGSILTVLVFWAAALIGYPDLRQQFPELSLLVIAFNYSLPMAAWMRFRGMEWRPTLEMSGATIGLGILLIGIAWLGIVPKSSLLQWQLGFCGLACPVMLVVMLFRLDLYTGRKGHHTHAA